MTDICSFGVCNAGLKLRNMSQNTLYGTDGEEKNVGSTKLSMRPIVEIDLQATGCTMTETKGADGKVAYKLEWKT